MSTAALSTLIVAGYASAANSLDESVIDLRDQAKKNCPEKIALATTKERDFGACVQPKFTACAATKPDDPFSCIDPAVAQCRSIIDEFLKTCGAAATPTCPTNEEPKDGVCVCQQGYERADGLCLRTVGGDFRNPEVVEFRVMKMTVKSMEGDVTIKHTGKGQTEAKKDEEITEGDEIFAGFDSRVVLMTDQGDVFILNHSMIRIAKKNEKRLEITLEKGEVKFEIKPVNGPTRPDVRIVLPTATASVRGTTFIARAMEDGTSEILVSRGAVSVTHNATGKETTVSDGEKIAATETDLGSTEQLTDQDKALFSDEDEPFFKNNRTLLYGSGAIVFLALFAAFLIKRKRR